jgi:hypothetical protein
MKMYDELLPKIEARSTDKWLNSSGCGDRDWAHAARLLRGDDHVGSAAPVVSGQVAGAELMKVEPRNGRSRRDVARSRDRLGQYEVMTPSALAVWGEVLIHAVDSRLKRQWRSRLLPPALATSDESRD